MKFNINRDDLVPALAKLDRIAVRGTNENVFIQTLSDVVLLTTANKFVELSIKVAADVEKSWVACVPSRKLLVACKSFQKDSVLQIDAQDGVLNVRSGQRGFSFFTNLDLQKIQKEGFGRSISVYGLFTSIKQASCAMADLDVRYCLNGMMLEITPGLLRCVATDGHRMAISDVEVSGITEDGRKMIVPRKGVLELLRLIPPGEPVTLDYNLQYIRFSLPDGWLICKLIDGRFPDYEKVLTKESDLDHTLSVSRDSIMTAVKSVSVVSDDKYRGVKLTFRPGKLNVYSETPKRERAFDSVEARSESECAFIGVNSRYLMDALKGLDGDEVKLRFRDKDSCLFLSSPGGNDAASNYAFEAIATTLSRVTNDERSP